ncbi:hypothetical protein CAOG_08738, partial [Capsaspora owczarzaki ATCC 30864]|uniref:hypothetical protein n=1 Tax=Capsaspora owczarzaki (strain ATCC 30864) TaxID=595528 RepID=UPI0003524801
VSVSLHDFDPCTQPLRNPRHACCFRRGVCHGRSDFRQTGSAQDLKNSKSDRTLGSKRTKKSIYSDLPQANPWVELGKRAGDPRHPLRCDARAWCGSSRWPGTDPATEKNKQEEEEEQKRKQPKILIDDRLCRRRKKIW